MLHHVVGLGVPYFWRTLVLSSSGSWRPRLLNSGPEHEELWSFEISGIIQIVVPFFLYYVVHTEYLTSSEAIALKTRLPRWAEKLCLQLNQNEGKEILKW